MPLIFDQIKGLADSKWSGILGSVAAMVGIDMHSIPGLITVHQKLTKDSGAIVTALCRVSITVSDGATFWFSYTDGKIWRRSSAGAWLLVYTTTPAAGSAGCLGAMEHDGFIYWATQSRLHRIAIGSISTVQNWTNNASEDWATFTNTDSEFHPMKKQGTSLFIGDGFYVSKVYGDTGAHAFKADALDLRTPLRVKCLDTYDIDLVIGTFIHANVNKVELIKWDTVSPSWSKTDPVPENGINSFIRDDNELYVQAGTYGKIYWYNGDKLIPYKRIPGTWSPTSYGEIYPDASDTLLGIPVFGFSNGAGNPTLQGVYGFGSYSKDYPKVMDLSFPVSAGLSGVQIGSVRAVGADLLVSWKYGATYGVDKLDYLNKYASAYIETMVLTPTNQRHFLSTAKKVFANYADLPSGTAIDFEYKKKNDVDWSSVMTDIDDTDLQQVFASENIPKVAVLQFRISLTVQNDSQTFTATTNDIITSNAHDLTDGDIITVASTTTLPAGLSVDTNYYVIDKSTNTFKVSLTSGGSAVDITDTGTGTHTWYRNEAPKIESVGWEDNLTK